MLYKISKVVLHIRKNLAGQILGLSFALLKKKQLKKRKKSSDLLFPSRSAIDFIVVSNVITTGKITVIKAQL